jgi:predicted nucleotidyltransferase
MAMKASSGLDSFDARSALGARGARSAAIFGSAARSEYSDSSDLISSGSQSRRTVFDYISLKEFIAGLFSGPVTL